jgi:hypothetical protein
MKTVFNNIYVSPVEYTYISDITPGEKLQYLFELYDIELKKQGGINLKSFFDTFNGILDPVTDDEPAIADEESFNDPDRTDVIIDDHHIMIESNSLRATRFIIQNFFETGYILERDVKIEKMFRRDKVTKYIRVYRIIGTVTTMSFN